MKGILNCVVDHTAFAQKRRKPPGSQDSSEEDMSISLAQALEATVCMVSPNSFCQSQLNFGFRIQLFYFKQKAQTMIDWIQLHCVQLHLAQKF